jgi:hypothetical protein
MHGYGRFVHPIIVQKALKTADFDNFASSHCTLYETTLFN